MKWKKIQCSHWITRKVAPKASNVPSQDIWKFTPCVLQDISLLGPLPCTHSTSAVNHSKQSIGYRWPCEILGWLVSYRLIPHQSLNHFLQMMNNQGDLLQSKTNLEIQVEQLSKEADEAKVGFTIWSLTFLETQVFGSVSRHPSFGVTDWSSLGCTNTPSYKFCHNIKC